MSPNFTHGAGLGHYEIKRQLGAGGMGEVYLAQDTKLDHKVAFKDSARCSYCQSDPHAPFRSGSESSGCAQSSETMLIQLNLPQ